MSQTRASFRVQRPLAAVGASGSLQFLLFGFAMGNSAGMAIPISRAFGAGDMDGMRRAVTTGRRRSAGRCHVPRTEQRGALTPGGALGAGRPCGRRWAGGVVRAPWRRGPAARPCPRTRPGRR